MPRHGTANGGVPPAPQHSDRQRGLTRCCARCRRGVPGFGELPCGYDQRCPNPKCLHAAPAQGNFDHLNTPWEER